ncbi:MAG TPA: hypothetical protein VG847_07200 [Chitinophagaceae bacterium]|nr:hypothetical protein [Chitinophagaceae bacterium]
MRKLNLFLINSWWDSTRLFCTFPRRALSSSPAPLSGCRSAVLRSMDGHDSPHPGILHHIAAELIKEPFQFSTGMLLEINFSIHARNIPAGSAATSKTEL